MRQVGTKWKNRGEIWPGWRFGSRRPRDSATLEHTYIDIHTYTREQYVESRRSGGSGIVDDGSAAAAHDSRRRSNVHNARSEGLFMS